MDAPGDEHRRAIAAGRAHLAAGEVDRARTLGRALDALDHDGSRRADALVFLSETELGHLRARIALRRKALAEASARPELQQLLHQKLALEVRFFEGRSAAEVHARAALELAESLGDEALRAGALAVFALLRFIGGEPDARGLAEEAHALAAATGDEQRLVDTSFCLAHILVWSAELEPARDLLEELDRSLGERDERVSAQASWFLSVVELYAGRLDLAGHHAERAKELGALYGRGEDEDPHSYLPVALVAAYRGDLDRRTRPRRAGSALAESAGGAAARAARGAGARRALGRRRARRDRRTSTWPTGPPTRRLGGAGASLVACRARRGAASSSGGSTTPGRSSTPGRGRRRVSIGAWVLAQAKRCRGLVAAG